jgi:phosphoribosylanthranilate isomerase
MGSQAKNAAPKLKICGVRSVEDSRLCRQLGVDYVGFNFYAGSKRHIEPAAARAVWATATKAEPSGGTVAVGVLVHARRQDVEAALAAFPELRILQFHGSLPPDLKLDRPWWQAVAVAAATDVSSVVVPSTSAAPALILFDSAVRPAGQPVPGGSGVRFDWQWLKDYRAAPPFGMAGGIAPGMLQDVMAWRPSLVDVCSGVESAPGQKDPAKLKALVEEWRDVV